MSDNLEKIIDVGEDSDSKLDVVETAKTPAPTVEADGERFGSLMKGSQKSEGIAALAPERHGKTTLMDVVHDLNFGGPKANAINPETLLAQTKSAVAKIDAIKETLETPNVGIRSPTHVQLLENKLQHIDENLRIALSKVGSEFPAEAAVPTVEEARVRVNPIERFLSFLSDGQTQLTNLGGELEAMSINKKEMSPVAMLAVQVKVGQITQELELFSNLLNQALQSIKTVMNIQV